MIFKEAKIRADHGDVQAMMALAKHYFQDADDESHELGWMYLEHAAEAGDLDALLQVAQSSRAMAKFVLESLEQDGYTEDAVHCLEDAHKWAKKIYYRMYQISTDKESESLRFLYDAYTDSIYWLSAIYCIKENYAGILLVTKDVASPVAQALYGLALYRQSETNFETNQAFELLKNALNPRFLSDVYTKTQTLELLRIETCFTLSELYRIQNNSNSAYNALSIILKNTKDPALQNSIQKFMSRYRKTLLGGYKYIG